MSLLKNVIVVGATGILGTHILAALQKAGTFNISVLARPSSTATYPSNVQVFKSDYTDKEGVAAAFKGQDAVVSAVTTLAVDQQRFLIDVAAEVGVKRFIPSEYGCDTSNPKVLEIAFVLQGKRAIADYLKEKVKTNPDLTWTVVITGPFLDWGLKVGFLGFDIENSTATIYDGGDNYFTATSLPVIGEGVAAVLAHPAETANRYVTIDSVYTTQNNILAAFEKVTGKKWTTKHVSSTEAIPEGQAKVKQGDFSGFRNLVLSVTYGKGFGGDMRESPSYANKLLGLKEDNLEETVRAVVSS